MNKPDPTASDIERLQQAAEWVQRLNESDGQSTVDEWLKWCELAPLNLTAFEQMQRVWDAFPAVHDRRPDSYASTHRVGRRNALILLAAGILLVVGCVGWFISRPEVRIFDTSIGELRHISLSDGSRIDLAPDSRLSTRLTLTRRDVQLERGQAFFAVAHSARRPFVVHIADLTVTTLGTAFDVRTGPDNTLVTVSEGRISVAPGAAQAVVHAGVGQRVTFSKSAQRLSVRSMDPKDAGSWRNGTLQFVSEPLEDVVSAVNRYSTRHVIVSPAFQRTRFTGTLSPPNIREWLNALEQIYEVKVVDQGSNGILIRPRTEEGAKR